MGCCGGSRKTSRSVKGYTPPKPQRKPIFIQKVGGNHKRCQECNTILVKKIMYNQQLKRQYKQWWCSRCKKAY